MTNPRTHTNNPSTHPPSQTSSHASENIKTLIQAQGRTITGLADHLRLHRMTVSRRLNGHTALTLDHISEIADWLQVSPATIITAPQPQP